MTTDTARNLIKYAFRLAGITRGPQRTASADQLADGLERLNSMLDAWRTMRLTVTAIVRTEFSVTIDQQVYTIAASGANWTLERPERIEQAGYVYTDSDPYIERPMDILTPQEWAAISPKDMTGPIPYKIFYQKLTPSGSATLWPVPSDDEVKVALYTWQTLSQFATLDTSAYLPSAAKEAIHYQLALRLAEGFPERQNMNQLAINQATLAFQTFRASNAPELKMVTESACRGEGSRGRYDILTNTWR